MAYVLFGSSFHRLFSIANAKVIANKIKAAKKRLEDLEEKVIEGESDSFLPLRPNLIIQ